MNDLNDGDCQECARLQRSLARGRYDPNYCVGYGGNTSLYVYSFQSARLAIAASRILLAAGADPTIRCGPENLTPFESAVRYQKKAIVRFYVEEGHQVINDTNRKRFFDLAAGIEEEMKRLGASGPLIDEEHRGTIEMRSFLTELEVGSAVGVGAEYDTARRNVEQRSLRACL